MTAMTLWNDVMDVSPAHLTHAVTAVMVTLVMLLAWPRAGMLPGTRARMVLAGLSIAVGALSAWTPLLAALWVLPLLLVWTPGQGLLGLVLPSLGVPAAWLLDGMVPPAVTQVLFVLGLLTRMAVFPFHGWWMRALYTPARPVAFLVWIIHPALLASSHWPTGSDVTAVAPALATLGIVAALCASLLALVQGQLWRLLGMLALSQAGLQFAAVMAFNPTAGTGALLLSGGKAVGLLALSLCVAAVKARTGTATLEQLGGLHRTMPRLAALMMVAGVMAAGFPGSLAFVAEDLVMHGVFEIHPLLTTGVLVVTSLNGMAVFRGWMRACLGSGPLPAFEVPLGRDLQRRELLGVGLCVAVLLVQGLLPSYSVEARARTTAASDTAAPGVAQR